MIIAGTMTECSLGESGRCASKIIRDAVADMVTQNDLQKGSSVEGGCLQVSDLVARHELVFVAYHKTIMCQSSR